MPLSERGIFIAVSGPSGSGKTTLCKEVLKLFPQLKFSVSTTTRPPRRGEVHGREYCFVSETEFREGIEKGEFAEWADNYGFLYGTSKRMMDCFLKEGADLLLDVDTRGAKALKKEYPGGIFVFVVPSSVDVLKERLKKRGSEADEAALRRLNNAMNEIKEILWYDYIIFNDRLDRAVDCFRSIYLAEKSRRERVMHKIQKYIG
jgi:guanylate kinase